MPIICNTSNTVWELNRTAEVKYLAQCLAHADQGVAFAIKSPSTARPQVGLNTGNVQVLISVLWGGKMEPREKQLV